MAEFPALVDRTAVLRENGWAERDVDKTDVLGAPLLGLADQFIYVCGRQGIGPRVYGNTWMDHKE